MSTTFTLKSHVPIRSDESDIRTYCKQFGLTLVSFLREPHRLIVTVEENLTDADKLRIANGMREHVISTLVTLETE